MYNPYRINKIILNRTVRFFRVSSRCGVARQSRCGVTVKCIYLKIFSIFTLKIYGDPSSCFGPHLCETFWCDFLVRTSNLYPSLKNRTHKIFQNNISKTDRLSISFGKRIVIHLPTDCRRNMSYGSRTKCAVSIETVAPLQESAHVQPWEFFVRKTPGFTTGILAA